MGSANKNCNQKMIHSLDQQKAKSIHNFLSAEEFDLNINRLVLGFFIFYLVLIILSQIFALDDLFLSFCSSGLFLLLPLIWGFNLLLLLNFSERIKLKIRCLMTFSSSKIFITWSIGLFLLNFIFFLTSFSLLRAVKLISIVSFFLFFPVFYYIIKSKDGKTRIKKSMMMGFIFSLLFGGLIPFLYIRSRSVFPFQMGIDFADHLATIADFTSGTRHPDFFNNSFEIILSIVCDLLRVSGLSVFWAAPLLQYIMFSSGIFLLVYKITKNPSLGIFSSLISGWGFGGTMAMDLIFLLRRNIIMSLLPWMLLLFEDKIHEEQNQTTFLRALFRNSILILPIIILYVTSNNALFNAYSGQIPSAIAFLIWPIFFIDPVGAHIGTDFSKWQGLIALFYSVLLFLILRRYLCKSNRHFYDLLFIFFLATCTLHWMYGFIFGILAWFTFTLSDIQNRNAEKRISLIFGLFLLAYLALNFSKKNPLSNFILDCLNNLFNKLNIFYYDPSAYQFSFDWKIDFIQIFGTVFSWLFIITLTIFPFFNEILYKKRPIPTFYYVYVCTSVILYFFPISFSYRLISFIAPLFGLFAMILIYNSLCLFEKHISICIFIPGISKNLKKYVLRFSFQYAELILFIILLLTLPANYDNYITWYNSISSTPSTGLSSFTPEDIEVSKIFLANFKGTSPIIITDPTTLKLLSGLSGLTCTLTSRTFINPTVTAPVYLAKEELFRKVILNFSNATLASLLSYFSQYAETTPIVIIVNNRTSNWITESEYSLLTPFKMFQGLYRLSKYAKTTLYSREQYYYVFLMKNPVLNVAEGPLFTVLCNNDTYLNVPSILTFYDLFTVNITLTLSGYNSYNITMPIGYHYISSWVNESLINPTLINEGKFLFFNNLKETANLSVLLSMNMEIKKIAWIDDAFMEGWKLGSPSRDGMSGFGYTSNGRYLQVYLSKGEIEDYFSIINYNLNITKTHNMSLLMKIVGSRNALFQVQFLTNHGIVRGYWQKAPLEETVIELPMQNIEDNSLIRGILIFLKTKDGLPANLTIDYIMLVHK